jgi:hypothetical protein
LVQKLPAAFSEGDEPPMTACGGNLIGGEISRNKQCPHEADLRRLRMRKGEPLFQQYGFRRIARYRSRILEPKRGQAKRRPCEKPRGF